MWYDASPAEYAKTLLYGAERSERSARHYDTEGKPWSPREAEYMRRQARRLRAMATLCEASKATRAGDVDFLGMSDPRQSIEELERAIAKAEKIKETA